MRVYRLYFRNQTAIVARDDFEAEDDQAALAIAQALCDAVNDVCQSIELWEGKRLIPVTPVPEQIREQLQKVVIEREEIIQSSTWVIASSRRLLERLNDVKSTPPET